MPPEFPETQRPDERDASAVQTDLARTPATIKRDREKYDELIAVALALLGMGSILFWGLGSGNKNLSWLKGSSKPGTMALNGGTSGSAVGGEANVALNPGASDQGPDAAVKGSPADVAANQKPQSNGNGAVNLGAGAVAGAAGLSGLIPKTAPDATAGSMVSTADETAEPEAKASPVPVPSAAVTPPAPPKATESPSVDKPGEAKFFSDVPKTSAIAPYIAAMSSRGIVGGFSDNTFKPDAPVTRAQFASMVTKAFEKPKVLSKMAFTDVKDAKLQTAVDEAIETGFMKGYPKGLFVPDKQISFAELQTALVTGMKLDPKGDPTEVLGKFSDSADVPKWAMKQVTAAIESGITLPGATTLDAKKMATRADAAILIHQALVKEGKIPAIK
jgi:S-layer homology domain